VRLKIRLAAIASALALAGGLALSFAGQASAATSELCVNDGGTLCAYFADTSPGYGAALRLSSTLSDPFAYAVDGSFHEIFLAAYPDCLAEEGSSHVVEAAKCEGQSNEQDEWVYEAQSNGEFVFINEATGLCLNADVYNDTVNAAGCSFGASQLWSP
jgi:hypothetical protein